MTEFDREYMRERREDYYRDLRQTIDDEHRRGLNPDPFYGWTQREIDNYNASLEVDGYDVRESAMEGSEE